MVRADAVYSVFSPLSSCLPCAVPMCLPVCLHLCCLSVCVGEWENSCNELQRMCIVRSLRPDRVPVVVTSYINNNLGHDFTDPPVLNMSSVLEDSSCRVPLIFVLSPGVVRGGEVCVMY